MSDHRSLAHLEEQLGPDRFKALIDSGNTGKVKAFCDTLVKDAIPTEMTIAGRTYELVGFLKGTETNVRGTTMVTRAKEMSAHLGKDDGQHILEHQDEIPVALRGKIYLVFTDWRDPDDSGCVAYLYWYDDRWVLLWDWLDSDDWLGTDRVLRRKSA